MELLIAATAHAHGIALYTRDAGDFFVIADEVEIRLV